MENIISRLILHNWQRKCMALVSAIIVWLFINHSITETKTISNVPVRIINLPADKTIKGLLPNGILSRRLTLTLSGTKDVIDDLEPGDLEVLLDASTATGDDWIIKLTKKNLVSLNPSTDLLHHINQVDHNEFIIKLSRLVNAKIPVSIENPTGKAPAGYEFLDVWPQHLFQAVSGPEEEIQRLKEQGFELTFDLNDISKLELDGIKSVQNQHNDEISFLIPKKWKMVKIPFFNGLLEELNDPEAQNLRIDFLRNEYFPLEKEIPIRIYFPQNNLSVLNPSTTKMADNEHVQEKNGVHFLTLPLYAYDVSSLFLSVVKDYIELVVVASQKSEKESLDWSLEFIDPKFLEDTYIAQSIGNNTNNKKREELLRKRFRDYMQRMTLYTAPGEPLNLKSHLENSEIFITPL